MVKFCNTLLSSKDNYKSLANPLFSRLRSISTLRKQIGCQAAETYHSCVPPFFLTKPTSGAALSNKLLVVTNSENAISIKGGRSRSHQIRRNVKNIDAKVSNESYQIVNTGKITNYSVARGFGFISPSDGGLHIFFHKKDLSPRLAAESSRVENAYGNLKNSLVRFDVVWDTSKATVRAANVAREHVDQQTGTRR